MSLAEENNYFANRYWLRELELALVGYITCFTQKKKATVNGFLKPIGATF